MRGALWVVNVTAGTQSDIMAEAVDSTSSEDEVVLNTIHPVGVQPYLFEPRIQEREERRELPVVVREDRTSNTNWCQCSECMVMPTTVECNCCLEIEPIKRKLELLDPPVACISRHPGFEPVCLNPYTLETAYVVYKREHGRMQCTLHEKYRYTAYHQLVRWCWGIMGRKVRVPLPSCAVRKIRDTYPEGGRVGFKWPDLD